MRRIYTLGETVMDIMFKEHVPVAAKAGGSMLNASVTLGRLKIPVNFISEFGTDKVGDLICSFLQSNAIDTSYVYRYNDGKSAVALAFLDENQNASYSFYKIYPQKRLNIPVPQISNRDIVMFGSYFGIAPEIRQTLIKILHNARQSGAIIIYDPNFRKTHQHNLKELLPFILENIRLADIIKGSDEDFRNIFDTGSASEAYNAIGDTLKALIYTSGKDGVDYCCNKKMFHVDAKAIEPISTIGAGDNFNAGLAYGLLKEQVMPADLLNLPDSIWEKILKVGIDFASEVCLCYDNYISENFANEYLNKID